MNFLGQIFEKLEHYRQTDIRTERCDRTHYSVAFVAGKCTEWSRKNCM